MLDVRLDEHNYYSLELKLAAELARQYVTSLNQWAGINLSNENQCTYTCTCFNFQSTYGEENTALLLFA